MFNRRTVHAQRFQTGESVFTYLFISVSLFGSVETRPVTLAGSATWRVFHVVRISTRLTGTRFCSTAFSKVLLYSSFFFGGIITIYHIYPVQTIRRCWLDSAQCTCLLGRLSNRFKPPFLLIRQLAEIQNHWNTGEVRKKKGLQRNGKLETALATLSPVT